VSRTSHDGDAIEIVPATIDRWDALVALFEASSGTNG